MTATTAAEEDWRAPLATQLLFLSAAAVVVAVHALPPALAMVRSVLLFVGLGGVLATTTKHWIDKSSSRIALAMMLGVLAAALAWHVPIEAYAGVARYQSTIELLVGVALLRKLSTRARLDATLAACTSRVSLRSRAPLLCLLACLLAAPLSVGAVAILCASLGEVVKPKLATAVVSMRTLGATMFVLPTTAGAAIVSASLPGLDRLEVMKLGLPLFLLVVVSCCARRPLEVVEVEGAPRADSLAALWPLGLFWALVVLLMAFTPARGTGAVALAAFGAFAAEAAHGRRRVVLVVDDVRDALRGMTTELVLLFACGILTGFLARAPLPAGFCDALRDHVATPAAATALILALPLLSLFGAHPVVLFSLAFPLLDRHVLGGGAREYVVWVTMFAIAQLVSPTSTSARLAAASLGVSPRRASFGSHGLFAGALGVAVWAYVVLVRAG